MWNNRSRVGGGRYWEAIGNMGAYVYHTQCMHRRGVFGCILNGGHLALGQGRAVYESPQHPFQMILNSFQGAGDLKKKVNFTVQI